ncbi:hypothetical protein SRRS_33660 [Sporomusa rhizae]|uniref:hypothetical protein n=1 Tax=Sporomusa rhizae TaxID=357999 RepID=UPI00352A16E1
MTRKVFLVYPGWRQGLKNEVYLSEGKVILMSISSNGVTVYRLNPDEIERFLAAKYGRKITAVNPARMANEIRK